MMSGFAFRFANVGRGNPRRQRAAFRAMRKHSRGGGVFAWVEIGEGDGPVNERRALRDAFPTTQGWRHAAVLTHTPITWSVKGLQLTEPARSVRAADGAPGGWPHKYWVVTRFDNGVTVINGHLPPGAFNGKRQRHEAKRVYEWQRMWRELVALVEAEHKAGRNVIVSGDFNRQGRFPHLHDRAVLVARSSVDRIYAIPAKGKRVKISNRRTQRLGIDFHKAIGANVRFVSTTKPKKRNP